VALLNELLENLSDAYYRENEHQFLLTGSSDLLVRQGPAVLVIVVALVATLGVDNTRSQ
jgi:hypothetical protein